MYALVALLIALSSLINVRAEADPQIQQFIDEYCNANEKELEAFELCFTNAWGYFFKVSLVVPTVKNAAEMLGKCFRVPTTKERREKFCSKKKDFKTMKKRHIMTAACFLKFVTAEDANEESKGDFEMCKDDALKDVVVPGAKKDK